jgi:hypothetical protein
MACYGVVRFKGRAVSLISRGREGVSNEHSPYSPVPAPSDFHLSGGLKDLVPEERFVSDDEIIE